MVDGEGQEHVLVVYRARAADEVLDEADDKEIKNGADEEGGEEGEGEGGGGGGGGREQEGDNEGEEEAAVAWDFEAFEERAREKGLGGGMEVEGDGGVYVD